MKWKRHEMMKDQKPSSNKPWNRYPPEKWDMNFSQTNRQPTNSLKIGSETLNFNPKLGGFLTCFSHFQGRFFLEKTQRSFPVLAARGGDQDRGKVGWRCHLCGGRLCRGDPGKMTKMTEVFFCLGGGEGLGGTLEGEKTMIYVYIHYMVFLFFLQLWWVNGWLRFFFAALMFHSMLFRWFGGLGNSHQIQGR